MNDKTFRHQMYESLMEEDIKEMTATHERLLKHIETFKKTFPEIYKIATSLKFSHTNTDYYINTMDKLKKTLDENKNKVFSYALYKSVRDYIYVFKAVIYPNKNTFHKHYVDTIITSMTGMDDEFRDMKQQTRKPAFYHYFIFCNKH